MGPHSCMAYTQNKYACEYMEMDVAESKRMSSTNLSATLSKLLNV